MANKARKLVPHYPSPEEWGRLCSMTWDKDLREGIGNLFGSGKEHDFPDSVFGKHWRSRVRRVNRIFANNSIPFQFRVSALRTYGPMSESTRAINEWAHRVGHTHWMVLYLKAA